MDKYEVLRKLGSGSFGEVMLIRKRENGHQYALKSVEIEENKERLDDSLLEIDLLKIVDHPYVMKMYDNFRIDKKVFLVLEYANGGDMFDLLVVHQKLCEKDAKFYLAEIWSALHYLHGLGIVYRDLKPENILLNHGHAVLTDFGLSTVNQSNHDHTVLNDYLKTECGRRYTLVGTFDYSAPEIILKLGHNKLSDWWSFGMLIYEMLTGDLPFTLDSKKEAKNFIKNLVSKKIKAPSYLSYDANHLMSCLLQRVPEKRIEGNTIKAHSFFSGIDFTKLENGEIEPPFVHIRVKNRRRKNYSNDRGSSSSTCKDSEYDTDTDMSERSYIL